MQIVSDCNHQTVDGIAYTFTTFAVALACLHWGEYVASILPSLPRRRIQVSKDEKRNSSSSSPTSKARRRPSQAPILDIICIISALICYLIALLLYFFTPHTWRHRAIFPILLSPPGTMLRFALSRLNSRPGLLDRFPIGTFLANMLATLVLAGVFAEQHRIGSGVRCNAMYAIQQGFCGCLSTVSTFAVEARSVKGWWKWVYIGGSVVLGHVFMLVVFGGSGWAKSYGPLCSE
jgi:CrcB protein